MSARCIFVHNVIAAASPAPAAGTALLPWLTKPIATIYDPCRVVVDVVSAAYDLTTAPYVVAGVLPAYGDAAQAPLDLHPVFSGARSGFTAEGPFLLYEVKRGDLWGDLGMGSEQPPHNVVVTGNFEPGDLALPTKFIFDLQSKRPILLPYPGSLSICSQYWGTWELNVAVLKHAIHAREVNPIDCEVPLTLAVCPPTGGGVASTRLFSGIPVGAHSFTYRDANVSNDPAIGKATIRLVQEDGNGHRGNLPNGVPFATDYPLVDPYQHASAYYSRWGLGNAKAMKITGAGLASQGLLTFHVSLL